MATDIGYVEVALTVSERHGLAGRFLSGVVVMALHSAVFVVFSKLSRFSEPPLRILKFLLRQNSFQLTVKT